MDLSFYDRGSLPEQASSCLPIKRGQVWWWVGSGLLTLILLGWLTGCARATKKPIPSTPFALETTQHEASIPSLEPEWIPDPSPEPTLTVTISAPHTPWQRSPVQPVVSPHALRIFEHGLAMGNNPHAFSKIGDGEIASHWFLTIFDSDPAHYNLGPYVELANTIETFSGSFSRESLAARAGFNTTRILDPLSARNDLCRVEESPLECELRIHQPSFALISLGTNQVWSPGIFDTELRQIVEICIARGVLPILATKGDNLEGDHRINSTIVTIAREYEIPLWNFWLAIQSLPDQGLQPDGEHLTWAENDFSDPDAMAHAWPIRNLSALQLLEHLAWALQIE